MIALHMNPKSLHWAGPNVLQCLHLVTYVVCKDPFSLAYAPAYEMVRGDRQFVKPILYKDGGLFQFMTNQIKDDESMVTINEVYKDWESLEYASSHLQNSKRIARMAIERSPDALEYMETCVLKKCPDILDVAITATSGKIAFDVRYFKLL
eukprot:scaffold108996_cov66-Attheya_sp.AAC.1